MTEQKSAWIRPAAQWAGLIGTTAFAVFTLRALHVPAAQLLGPLVVGIGFAVGGAPLKLPGAARVAGQALIGCLMAVALGSAFGPAMLARLPAFLAIGVSSLAMSFGLGWGFSRLGWFEGSTAVWGLAPGGSAAMVSMAETYGADARVTAVMQYFRVLLAAASAITAAHVTVAAGAPAHAAPWLVPVTAMGLFETALLAILGVVLARRLKFPAGVFLIPGLAGAAFHGLGWMHPEAPPLLAALAYAVVGWTIGLSFTRPTLMACARAMPRILAATLALILVCGLAGLAVAALCGVDPLTGYLATTPGGVDAIMIVAASTPVDLPFILAAQVTRVILVLLAGPAVAAFVARQVGGRKTDQL